MEPEVGRFIGFEDAGEVFGDDAGGAMAASAPFCLATAFAAGEVCRNAGAVTADLFPDRRAAGQEPKFAAMRAGS
ncbi:hypothetical protein GCM10009628_13500 [Paeniglutamicibacter kerguelensis]